MDAADIAEEGVGIVMRGNFNPAIISPAWMVAEKLIGRKDAEAVEPELIVPQVAIFSLPWVRFDVSQDRFGMTARDPQEYDRCRDLAVGIFSTLRHTPVSALGINRWMHLKADSLAEWHAIGDRVTPKDVWEGQLTLPGVARLAMEAVRPDDYGGRIIVQFEPSNRYPSAVYIEQNDHYSLQTGVVQPKTREDQQPPKDLQPSATLIPVALEILSQKWADSLARAEKVIDHIWGLRR
jgi:hypothetical protein